MPDFKANANLPDSLENVRTARERTKKCHFETEVLEVILFGS